VKIILLLATAWITLAQNVPQLPNAHFENRAFSGNLETQLRSASPAWFGYQIKTIKNSDGCCWMDSSRGCFLEGESQHGTVFVRSQGPVHLEGSDTANVLFRVANNAVEKIQIFSTSCPLDAGGLPFVWLTGVPAAASLQELHRLVESSDSERLTDGAIFAIAQHDAAEADTILNDLAAASEPERTREKVAFWLGSSRGASGVKTLLRMLKDDPSDNVRDKVVFGLSVSKQPEGMEALVKAAKTDASPHVRGQALFWLAQKAGKQAAATITDAIQNDPDTGVKKKAVFALSQLPKDDGVPKLIEIARTQRNPEVRKQAFFWLGQSGDPRALQFIEQVLEK
jgi:hypothetical protein